MAVVVMLWYCDPPFLVLSASEGTKLWIKMEVGAINGASYVNLFINCTSYDNLPINGTSYVNLPINGTSYVNLPINSTIYGQHLCIVTPHGVCGVYAP